MIMNVIIIVNNDNDVKYNNNEIMKMNKIMII